MPSAYGSGLTCLLPLHQQVGGLRTAELQIAIFEHVVFFFDLRDGLCGPAFPVVFTCFYIGEMFAKWAPDFLNHFVLKKRARAWLRSLSNAIMDYFQKRERNGRLAVGWLKD